MINLTTVVLLIIMLGVLIYWAWSVEGKSLYGGLLVGASLGLLFFIPVDSPWAGEVLFSGLVLFSFGLLLIDFPRREDKKELLIFNWNPISPTYRRIIIQGEDGKGRVSAYTDGQLVRLDDALYLLSSKNDLTLLSPLISGDTITIVLEKAPV